MNNITIREETIRKGESFFKVKEKTEDGIVVDVSVEEPDRYREVLLVDGAKIDNYLKNPVVLFAHNHEKPVGKSKWVKKMKVDGKKVLRSKIEFGRTNLAQDVRMDVEDGILNAMSHGYIPLKEVRDKAEIKALGYDPDRVDAVVTEWELLEQSVVAVPANASALVVREYKSPEMKEYVMENCKGVVPYQNLPIDDSIKWDKNKAKKAVLDWASDSNGNVNFKKFVKAHLWYDSSAPDDNGDGLPDRIGDYKLPIATIVGGKLTAVWKGIQSAMGVINGAMGGVDIPQADKKKVYNVLVKYYKKHGDEPPEFNPREYSEEIAKIYDIIQTLNKRLASLENSVTIIEMNIEKTNKLNKHSDLSEEKVLGDKQKNEARKLSKEELKTIVERTINEFFH